ncbi:9994_t:CDS:2, partial [Gigaspora margarita]
NKLDISDALQRAFKDVKKIASIRPFLIDGTSYATNQWIIVFETTNDPKLENNIPQFIYVMDNKVTTKWQTALKVCYFCEKTGHIKREFPQFIAAVEQQNRLRERKLAYSSEDSEAIQVQTNGGAGQEDQKMGEVQEQIIAKWSSDTTNLESNATAILPMAE